MVLPRQQLPTSAVAALTDSAAKPFHVLMQLQDIEPSARHLQNALHKMLEAKFNEPSNMDDV